MPRQGLPLLLRISGVALLSFSSYAAIQFVSFGCISTVPLLPLSCYLGVEPTLIPYFLGTGAVILLVGVLSDSQMRRAEIARVPPGLGFVVLGGAVLEIGSTDIHGFGSWYLSPMALTILAAGLVLLARGSLDWWESVETGRLAPSVSSPRDSESLGDDSGATPRIAPRRWMVILGAFGVFVAAFGLFALVLGLLAKDGCVSVPDANLCYDPGLEPLISLPFVIAGAALLLTEMLVERRPAWVGFPSPGWSLAFLVLAGGVVELAVALYVFGDHSSGWTAAVYAPTLAAAGAFMAVRGASRPSPKPNSPRRLVVLGVAGLLMELGYVWFIWFTGGLWISFPSSAAWADFLGGTMIAEGAFAAVAYGILFSTAYELRRLRIDLAPFAQGPEPQQWPGEIVLLLLSSALILGAMVGWFVLVGQQWFVTPYLVLGVSVHSVPFLAVLLGLTPPAHATRRFTPA